MSQLHCQELCREADTGCMAECGGHCGSMCLGSRYYLGSMCLSRPWDRCLGGNKYCLGSRCWSRPLDRCLGGNKETGGCCGQQLENS